MTIISLLFDPVSLHGMGIQTRTRVTAHLQWLEWWPSSSGRHALVSGGLSCELSLLDLHVAVTSLVHIVFTLLSFLLLTLSQHLLYTFHWGLRGKTLLIRRWTLIHILGLSLILQTQSVLGLVREVFNLLRSLRTDSFGHMFSSCFRLF